MDVALQIAGNNNTTMYDGSFEEYSKKQLQEKKSPKLQVDIFGEGEGILCPSGSRVLVHYVGKLTDGT